MVLLLVSFTVAAGGDFLAAWPRSEDIKGYESSAAYRLSLDFSFYPRHRIGMAYHPTQFDSANYSYQAQSLDFYYGFDLTTVFFDIAPKLFVILGGCYHPWRLELSNQIVELPTGKVEFKDFGYLAGLEFNYAPIDFLDLRLGSYYYYLMSEHMDRLGYDDGDERYITGFAGLRFRL